MNKEFTAEDMRDFAEYYRMTQGNVTPELWGKDLFEVWKSSHTEVKIFDWEILTCKDGLKEHEYVDGKSGGESCLTFGCDIHSVRRLSDNEVFAVGDDIQQGEITGIFISKYGLDIDVCKNDKYYDRYTLWQLKKIEKRKPLFTTEDGVDIFDGDLCYWYNLYHNYIDPIQRVIHDEHKYYGMPPYGLWFNSIERAEEYQLMNKRCLSVNDVIKLCEEIQFHNRIHDRADEDYYAVYVSLLKTRLKELAKQKLDNQ